MGEQVTSAWCIVARLMPLAPLIPRIIADIVAIAEALRIGGNPDLEEIAKKLHDPEKLKGMTPHL